MPISHIFIKKEVWMLTQKGKGLNCFELLKRNNECLIETTRANINSQFIFERLETTKNNNLRTKIKKQNNLQRI